MISETKIDESFPKGNFLIEGFSTPYRLDRDSKGGGDHVICKGRYTFLLLKINPSKTFLLSLTCKILKY